MMLLHLLKKDFLIIKKYVFIVLVFAVGIPLFVLWQLPEYAGVVGFVFCVFFSVLMLLQYVSVKEYQFPKAATLLCATPYRRSHFVLSKYVFCLLAYAACCLIFWLESLLFSGFGGFHVGLAVFVFFAISALLGVYLPLQFKLGYEKTGFANTVILVATSFIFPQLLKLNREAGVRLFAAVPPALLYGGVLVLAFIVLGLSASLSIKVFRQADLA